MDLAFEAALRAPLLQRLLDGACVDINMRDGNGATLLHTAGERPLLGFGVRDHTASFDCVPDDAPPAPAHVVCVRGPPRFVLTVQSGHICDRVSARCCCCESLSSVVLACSASWRRRLRATAVAARC
jgi:hypothetical protein